MPRGRPRIPDSIHRLRGTYRKSRHGSSASKPNHSEKTPTMPRRFDARRRAIWKATKEVLLPLGLWSRTYAETIVVLVDSIAHYEVVERDIAENGHILEIPKLTPTQDVVTFLDDDGVRKKVVVRKANPALRERTKAVAQIRMLLTELGLTPASLSRLGSLGDELPSDPFEDLLSSRN